MRHVPRVRSRFESPLVLSILLAPYVQVGQAPLRVGLWEAIPAAQLQRGRGAALRSLGAALRASPATSPSRRPASLRRRRSRRPNLFTGRQALLVMPGSLLETEQMA